MKLLIVLFTLLRILFGGNSVPTEQPKKDMFEDPRITVIQGDEEIDYDSIIDDWDDDEE